MNRIINKFSAVAMLSFGLFMGTACSDDLTIGDADKSILANAGKVSAFVRDVASGKPETVIELRTTDYKTSIYVGINQSPGVGVDVSTSYDADYLKSYNDLHGTDFKLFPKELVNLSNEGKFLIAPNEKRSFSIDLTLKPSTSLEKGA